MLLGTPRPENAGSPRSAISRFMAFIRVPSVAPGGDSLMAKAYSWATTRLERLLAGGRRARRPEEK